MLTIAKVFKIVKKKYKGIGFGVVETNTKELKQYHSYDLEFEGGIKISYNCTVKDEVERIEGIKVAFVDKNGIGDYCESK